MYVPGDTPLWLDPSSGWARVGNLPASDQGRRALVVAPDTTDLIVTPVSKSTDNRTIETREFVLAEKGKARVIETTEAWGLADFNLRQSLESVEGEKIKDVLKPYVESMYLAEGVASAEFTKSQDLSTPYHLKLEATGVKRAWTEENDAGVAILLPPLLSSLPQYFWREEDNKKTEEGSATGKKPKERSKTDIVLPQPFVTEWRYRIVPPPRFTPHPLPKNETIRMGPVELSKEFAQADEGVVTATLRFDTVKRRLTREEAEALRSGVLELQKADPTIITFEQTGQAYLAAGRIREAIAEFRRLARLHPGEALHAAQTAQALLAPRGWEKPRGKRRSAPLISNWTRPTAIARRAGFCSTIWSGVASRRALISRAPSPPIVNH